jgi:hypothetical protein
MVGCTLYTLTRLDSSKPSGLWLSEGHYNAANPNDNLFVQLFDSRGIETPIVVDYGRLLALPS